MTPPRPRHRAGWIVAAVLTAAVVLLVAIGTAAFDTAQDRWAWRLADLDRNELHLRAVPESIEDGTVVEESSGHVVVRYSREITNWMGGYTGEVESICYQFSFADPDDFYEVACS
ncbi:hypothetical protein [Promicromonospora sp. NPDC050262]|uniref:hypothetical protein n=1 Tax=Promicromonospora sp. NPDC050262 TaxID=3155036 RepID=UPI0034024F34